jgi:S1-C subfamily serine protease
MKFWILILNIAFFTSVQFVSAQTPKEAPNQSSPKNSPALQLAQSAVVSIKSYAIDEAPSARTLGQERQGTGVVIGKDGLILTIGYLILETKQIDVRTHQNKSYPARVVAYDQATGFGLIKSLIPFEGIEPVKLGKTKDQKNDVMLWVGSAGDAIFLSPTALKDIRSFTGFWEYHLEKALYTSPPVVNHSGAGLFNLQGELIGIGSLFMQDIMPTDHPHSLMGNMFVPTEILEPIFTDLLKNGVGPNSQRAWLGINAVERQGRIQIIRVTPDSPAQLAGMRPGQWLLGLNGETIESLEAFYKKIWGLPLQTGNLRITVFDGLEIRHLPIPLVDRSTSIKKPAGI